jgi:hypothetical protein
MLESLEKWLAAQGLAEKFFDVAGLGGSLLIVPASALFGRLVGQPFPGAFAGEMGAAQQ